MGSGGQRDHWVDAARATSVLLVILNHSVGWTQDALGMGTDFAARDFTIMLKDMRLPLLFFISGIFAAKWAHVTYRELFRGKLAFIMWPYLVWSVFVAGYLLAATFLLPGVEQSPTSVLVGLALAPIRPLAELWFLWVLVFCFLLQRLFSRIPAAVLVPIAIVASVVVTFMNAQHSLEFIPQPVKFIFVYGPFFFIASRASEWIRAGMRLRWVQISAVVYAVIWFAAKFSGILPTDPALSAVGQFAAIPAGIGLAFCLSGLTWLRTIGADTLPVYASHTTTLVVIYGVLHFIAPGIIEVPWLAQILPFVAAFGAAFAGVMLARYASGSWLFKPPASVVNVVRATPASRRGRDARMKRNE